jgi:acetyl-CoA acyltransferase
MRDVVIAGAGMTAFGKLPDRTVKSMASEATHAALADSGLDVSEIEAAFFSNATSGLITGQEMIRGQTALRETGLLGIPIVNVENACASASTAVQLAYTAVGSGQVETAIVVGAEKLTHPDKRVTFGAIGSAIDLDRRAELETLIYGDSGADPGSGTLFMDIYADMTTRYMERSGATAEDFARVTVKNHHHGALNPHAQYRNEVTVEEVLASRAISGPLTLLMCSPIGDGAAALVVTSAERARRQGIQGVRIRACALVSGSDDGGESGPERAAKRAYAQAGLGPSDIDVAEVHDAAAPAELIVYEELGLCPAGGGPELLASGATALGGRHPVNPSGGLLSKGHPVGATGCAQLVELTDQLRGRAGARQVDGARVALAENAGGYLGPDQAAAAVTILSVD